MRAVTQRARRLRAPDRHGSWESRARDEPPTLIVWGKNDAAFTPAGAQAYLRDLPKAELHLIDAGHFAVEEQPVLIAQYMVHFLDRLPTEPIPVAQSSNASSSPIPETFEGTP